MIFYYGKWTKKELGIAKNPVSLIYKSDFESRTNIHHQVVIPLLRIAQAPETRLYHSLPMKESVLGF